MNRTAILHIIGTLLIGAGVFASGQAITVGLLVAGAVFFIAGIVVARRNGSDAATVEPSD